MNHKEIPDSIKGAYPVETKCSQCGKIITSYCGLIFMGHKVCVLCYDDMKKSDRIQANYDYGPNYDYGRTPFNSCTFMDDPLAELEKMHEPTECPHPEWLGVWAQVLKGISMAIKVEWDHCRFKVTDNKSGQQTNEDGVFYNPTLLGWEMIEPAPLEARTHTKPRPAVDVGWDPYNLG